MPPFLLLLMAVSAPSTGLPPPTIGPVCSRQSSLAGLPTAPPPPRIAVSADSTTPVAAASVSLATAIETGTSDPYLAATPNFDGTGFSLGELQWNLLSLAQRTFGSIDDHVFATLMPIWGDTFKRALHAKSSAEAIDAAKTMQILVKEKWRFKTDAREEIRAFLNSPESRRSQNLAAGDIYSLGYARASQWAAARGEAKPTPREIATFVDNEIFSGALDGVWLPQAAAFRAQFADDGAMIAFASRWLASCPATGPGLLYGANEGTRNAKQWMTRYPVGTKLLDERALLFAFGFVRAVAAHGPPKPPSQHGIFKAQVLSRRGLIALGLGQANGVSWPGGALDQ